MQLESSLDNWRGQFSGISGTLGLFSLVGFAISLSEVLVSADEGRALAAGHSIRCTKGCGACCRQVVPVSAPEAFFLANQVKALESGDIQFSFHENRIKLASSGLENASLIDQAPNYFSLGIVCPFLKEESCSIHLIRPMACREHLVLSDPEFCGTFPNSRIEPMPITVSLREVLASVTAELLGNAPVMIPMIRMFEWVEYHKEWQEQKWDAQYLLDLFVQKVKAHT